MHEPLELLHFKLCYKYFFSFVNDCAAFVSKAVFIYVTLPAGREKEVWKSRTHTVVADVLPLVPLKEALSQEQPFSLA